MEQNRSSSNRVKALSLLILAGLLSACFDGYNGTGSRSTNTTVGVIGTGGGSDDDQAQPTDGTDTALTDPAGPSPEAPAADAEPVLIALSWQPTPGQIDGYIIHTGPSPDTATAVITVTSSTTVEYDASSDLGLDTGEQSCFRIKAYNSEGQSGFSEAVCYTVQRIS